MYIPPPFRVDELEVLHAFMRTYSFATLVTATAQPAVTHLPLLLDAGRGAKGTLIGHFARPNPHWTLDHVRSASVAIFHGPHAYVSPSWYRSGKEAVPTWNYAAVHAHGRLVIMEDLDRAKAILAQTVRTYDSAYGLSDAGDIDRDGARADAADAAVPAGKGDAAEGELFEKLARGIIAFEMPVEAIEGKFKLGQNRPAEDRLGVVEALEGLEDAGGRALAEFARGHLKMPRR